jgi:parvulin-like peptidyl-prolyl isomerase
MPLKGIQKTNPRYPAILAAALFLVLSSSPVPVNAQKTRPLTIAELQKKYIITTITKADIQLILKEASPATRKRLAEDPELKKSQAQNLRELLALGSAAVKSGIVDSLTARELENIRTEISATVYDQRIKKDRNTVPFSTVTQAKIDAFYAKPGNEVRFNRFLDDKIELIKKTAEMRDRVITEEERSQAKDFFAKIAIYDAEAKLKAKSLGAVYKRAADLKVHLQQIQYLARLYSEQVLASKIKVTDEEVQAYIQAHPELTVPQKAKARQILARAKSGEDFAALANEFSEDPGNIGEDGEKNGGLYKDVELGKMVTPFEQGALALEPGQISRDLVETDFGYHIIMLERKGTTYDVRHILIATNAVDADDSSSKPQPVNIMVRSKLETAKEKRVMAEILKKNPVSVPEDFDVSVN